MTDLFISYAHEDRAVARQIADELTARGIDVWWDENLRAGDEWKHEISTTLDTVPLVVALWSPSSVSSEWVGLEAGYALVKKKLIPVTIVAVMTPSPFDSIQAADLTLWSAGSTDRGFDNFVSDVEIRLAARHDAETDSMLDTRLINLRKTVRLGSRLISAGLLTGMPLLVLSGLLWKYLQEDLPQNPDAIATPVFIVSASTQLILVPIVAVLGWAGWIYLRQAKKMKHVLEFRDHVANRKIEESLTGSSLVSTSPTFVRILCFAFVVGSTIIPFGAVAGLSTSLLLLSKEYYWATTIVFDLVVTLPFFLVAIGGWIRWFNPAQQGFLPWLLRGFFRKKIVKEIRQNLVRRVSTRSIFNRLEPEEKEKLTQALDSTVETVLASFDRQLATTYRELGVVRFWREYVSGETIETEFGRVLSTEFWDVLGRVFPGKSPEDRVQILLDLLS